MNIFLHNPQHRLEKTGRSVLIHWLRSKEIRRPENKWSEASSKYAIQRFSLLTRATTEWSGKLWRGTHISYSIWVHGVSSDGHHSAVLVPTIQAAKIRRGQMEMRHRGDDGRTGWHVSMHANDLDEHSSTPSAPLPCRDRKADISHGWMSPTNEFCHHPCCSRRSETMAHPRQ